MKAIDLVRGIPFAQRPRRRYAWAEPVQQEMLAVIVDAIYELAHRRFMAGEWQAAEQNLVAGLALEPGIERLWRLRILAAHQSRSRDREERAIEQLLDITDGLGSDLEPKTEDLLAALRSRADLATLKEAL